MKLDMAERRTLARAISAVENGGDGSPELLKRAYASRNPADIIGVTGPPGAGKSTLVDRLAVRWSARGRRVAVLAADPSSPYSFGALLGDRVRMRDLAGRPEIFMRSLSQRGAAGGIAAVTAHCCALLRSYGFDLILIETIGAGQSDIAVANIADCILAVSVPGLGDGLQAEKAGLLEIADLHVVNKCDLPGASAHALQIAAVLDLVYTGNEGASVGQSPQGGHAAGNSLPGIAAIHARHGEPGADAVSWRPPVIQGAATTGEGIEKITAAIEGFLEWQAASSRLERRRRRQMAALLLDRLPGELLRRLAGLAGAAPHELALRNSEMVVAGGASPEDALDSMCTELLPAGSGTAAEGATSQGGPS